MSGFVFRNVDRIGSAGAEEDRDFLTDCFVDIGVASLVQNLNDNRTIIVGRTGSGKSALILSLVAKLGERAILMSPEDLALRFLSNSTILRFFIDLGVNLDPFFKLLWKHVIVVEILKQNFELDSEEKQEGFLARVTSWFSNSRECKESQEAIQYLITWGAKFWVETEYRVKEITRNIENRLIGQVRSQAEVAKLLQLGASAEASSLLSEVEKTELKNNAQRVVSEAQVQDLENVMKMLDSLLTDRQKSYYVFIDKLDEDWVEESTKYRLIKALIETSKDFIRVKNVKIVLALRRDLLDLVFQAMRLKGVSFQAEKYKSLYLPIEWNGVQLLEVLDKRINHLIKRQYTKSRITYRDLLPDRIKKEKIDEFILARCEVPRDIIAFFNECIKVAAGKTQVKTAELKEAEAIYSRDRLDALLDEWGQLIPSLKSILVLLYSKTPSFCLDELETRRTEDVCLDIATGASELDGMLGSSILKFAEGDLSGEEVKKVITLIFYRVGLVGLKVLRHESTRWARHGDWSFSTDDLFGETRIQLNPKYYRVFGVPN